MAKQESQWISRDDKRKPKDKQMVLAYVQGENRANDHYEITRYWAAKDLFVCEGYTYKVARWMPMPHPGRRSQVNWMKWSETFAERAK